MATTIAAPTAEQVLEALNRLPAHERLQVLAQVLSETTKELLAGRPDAGQTASQPTPEGLERLRQLDADLAPLRAMNLRISEEEIDEARREMWGNFPRGDIA